MPNFLQKYGQVAAVLGCQWGDEGKGKLVDILAENYDITLRATGGANAGHTVYVGENSKFKIQNSNQIQSPNIQNPKQNNVKKFVFHLIPAGILHEGKVCVIGNGCVISLPTLLEEVETLKKEGIEITGRLFISDRAHLLFEYHKIIDGIEEERKGKNKVGTTKRGIGPAYTDKIARRGIRLGDLLTFDRFAEKVRENVKVLKQMYGEFDYDIEKDIEYYRGILPQIKPLLTDALSYIDENLKSGKTILMEGANGALLDIDHGTFPFVTSSNATVGGLITGTGMAPNRIKGIIGIFKAYCTRVGEGPFPTELTDELGNKIREAGGEYGATTGRPRRCGWFDAAGGKYARILNGLTAINLTKIDVLTGLPKLKIGIGYKYNGQNLKSVPSDLEIFKKVEMEYIEMDGWIEDLSQFTEFEQLPENCKKYIQKLEELLDCPITFIGVGQRRDQMIMR